MLPLLGIEQHIYVFIPLQECYKLPMYFYAFNNYNSDQ